MSAAIHFARVLPARNSRAGRRHRARGRVIVHGDSRRARDAAKLRRLGDLELAWDLTIEDVTERDELRRIIGSRLAREYHTLLRATHAHAFASRGVGRAPTGGDLRRARRAQARLAAAAEALGHPLYAMLGSDRVARLIRETTATRPRNGAASCVTGGQLFGIIARALIERSLDGEVAS